MAERFGRWALAIGVIATAVALAIVVLVLGSKPVPPVDDPSFSFVVVGDFGTGGEDEVGVADRMEKWVGSYGADALLTTGDNFYPRGDPQYFERAWDEPYGWTEQADLDVLPSLGNHDFEYLEGAAVIDHLDMAGAWYTESFRQADVFVLDANRVSDPAQMKWLETALERSAASWKLAVFHHPAYSCSEHGDTDEVIERWVPLFERGGVDLVVNGHDHNYQRFDTVSPTYVVSGGGGAQLYGLETCDEGPQHVEANDSDHHFLYLEGDSQRLRGRAISADGDVIDDFALEQGE